MKKTYNTFVQNNQSGQALLFVVVAMTIALAVVTSVSLRTISSVSRVARTDTASRVLATAEGGAERFLSLSSSSLASVVSNPSANCSLAGATYDSARAACRLVFDDGAGPDRITAYAFVTVSNWGNANRHSFTVKRDHTYEANLNGYNPGTLTLCWRGNTSDIYYVGYGDTGSAKNLVCKGSGCVSSGVTGSVSAGGASASCDAGYNNSYNVTGLGGIGTKRGFRIRAIGADADVQLAGAGGNTFPNQGYTITSVGELSTSSNVQSIRTVTVHKSLPYLPAIFDFAIYSGGNLPF